MQKISITFMITAIILLNPSSAETVKKYVEVCTENQKNKMGPELCECVGNKAKGKFSKEEFDFFYAIAAKDQQGVNKGHATLDATQKMNVMQLSMMGPSQCANELAQQENSSSQPDLSASETATTVDSAAEASGSASQ